MDQAAPPHRRWASVKEWPTALLTRSPPGATVALGREGSGLCPHETSRRVPVGHCCSSPWGALSLQTIARMSRQSQLLHQAHERVDLVAPDRARPGHAK